MATSFQQRRLRFTFRLASGTFNKSGEPDKVEFDGFRAAVDIEAAGGFQFAMCRGRIFGVSKEVMDRLTVINYQNLSFMRNVVTVEATDNDGRFSTVFMGEIFIAQPNYASAPDVPFEFEARSGVIGSLAPSIASSFPGARQVSEIMESLAKELGVTFENNGVTDVLVDQTLSGTALEKVYKVKEAANIQVWYSQSESVLAIAPMGVARKSDPVQIGSDTGMVGWPLKRWEGIEFTMLFNPAIRHGCKVNVKSSVPSCNGEWYIGSMHLSLSANYPGGPWFGHYIANPVNLFIVNR